MVDIIDALRQRAVYSEEVLIRAISQAAIGYGGALAMWRLPMEKEKNLIIDFSGKPRPAGALDELGQGFVFSPFSDGETKLFIEAGLYYRTGMEVPVSPLNITFPEEFEDLMASNSESPKRVLKPYVCPTDAIPQPTDKGHFITLVQDAVDAIVQGEFQKVVPSRCKATPLANDFDVIDAFDKLCAAYPAAFVSLVSVPGVGTWLGASPELLIGVSEGRIFRTVSLAGTQKHVPGIKMAQVAWTQKEIEEQALVSRYIINCFKRLRLREFEETGPKTVVAGNLMHLKTHFEVDMAATNFPQLGAVMLELLHPTSAVCGMPKAPAMAFLREREQYHRAFYSGYLGPVDMAGNTDIFVNLRCMQVHEGHGILYAGAGVTEDSIPEKEWEETEMKINTILNVIQKHH